MHTPVQGPLCHHNRREPVTGAQGPEQLMAGKPQQVKKPKKRGKQEGKGEEERVRGSRQAGRQANIVLLGSFLRKKCNISRKGLQVLQRCWFMKIYSLSLRKAVSRKCWLAAAKNFSSMLFDCILQTKCLLLGNISLEPDLPRKLLLSDSIYTVLLWLL